MESIPSFDRYREREVLIGDGRPRFGDGLLKCQKERNSYKWRIR